jgi:hypothetical protein
MVKPGTTRGAGATDKATEGQPTWLRTECRDGKAASAERPSGLGENGGSQSLHNTAAARPRLFRRLDQIVRRRLRAILRKQDRRPSMGRSQADRNQWPNVFFADQGLFTLYTAYANVRYSR